MAQDFSKRELPTIASPNAPAPPSPPALQQLAPQPGSSQLDKLMPFAPGTCLDGRYVIERELGRGGFGVVLLARETTLDNRRVALKLPRPDIAWSTDQITRFREEASKVAQLNERGIPTIHQVFELVVQDRPTVCVVQQYVPGTSLSRWWKRHQDLPDAYDKLAAMLADIAAVLAVPHAKSLFHRDLKPDNILVDGEDRPYVLDFGLALRVNERTREEGLLAGTIPYMAPEQVRGETRKIDARTDIWALGASLYQLLTGQLPFDGEQQHDVFAAIKDADPQPPRQIRPEIPEELERITLRCLEKLKADRYGTARDLERDLRTWRDAPAQHRGRIPANAAAPATPAPGAGGTAGTGTGSQNAGGQNTGGHGGAGTGGSGPGLGGPATPGEPSPSEGGRRTDPIANADTNPGRGPSNAPSNAPSNTTASAPSKPLSRAEQAVESPIGRPAASHRDSAAIPVAPRVIPKGLDSFGSRDADFFLELLPGIPERNLLPPSINFWKERIEQDELAQQVPVGLLSGPSGCGKSSLMKAGILPRLRPSVTAVYLEATQGDTESRLLSALRAALRKAGRPIPDDFTLVESMEWLASAPTDVCSPPAACGHTEARPAASQPAEAKVLVVIDQFEQWLYARRADSTSVLRDAMGQCDGGRLQAILMVRDDYWTPISDFLKTLDIGLLEGENWQRVSLFDLSHARKVLTLFGQAYDKLPAIPSPLSSEQTAFLNAAVTSLAEKDKVVSVRLSVFAELMRGRDWTRETLAKVGGADGVGVAFLKQVREWYANDPSSGVHGASNWLLRQWGESAYVKQIDETSVAPSMDREWFTLAVKVKPEAASSLLGGLSSPKSAKPITFHYTFVVFPAGEYTIGSPDDEPNRAPDEVRHRARLTRPFAILNREVTFAELIAFNRERYEYLMGQMSQRPESSVAGVDWYDAVQFSRWLGTQLDPPLSESDQAYADPRSEASGGREPDPQASWAPRNWPLDVKRRGFRLPTEAEWEIASRGGVRSSYGFGTDAGLLDRYGWFQDNCGNRMHSPMALRPGHRGLFDMHGNALEWVHDWDGECGRPGATDPLGAVEGSARVIRGGSFASPSVLCRPAVRRRLAPSLRDSILGFRLALSFVGVPAESGQDKKK